MQISKIYRTEIEFQRVEAEFYQPKYLNAKKKIGEQGLYHFGVKVLHPAEVKRVYSDDGTLQIVLAQNVKDNIMDWSVIKKMDESMKPKIGRNELKEGDVLVTRSGANYGQTTVITIEPQEEKLYACADVLVLKPGDIGGPLLSTYLNTSVGKLLMNRGVYGAGQPHVAPSYISKISFPEYLLDCKDQINKLIYRSRRLQKLSNSLYTKANTIFEKELGLDSIILNKQKCFNTSFRDVVINNRFDSGFFNPNFSIIYNKIAEICKIQKWEIKKLGLTASNFKYGSSDKLNYTREGIPFLRIADLREKRFEKDSLKYISESDADRLNHAKVHDGDILISRSGSLGITVPIHKDLDGSVFGSYFIKFRPHKSIDNEYLSFYLNSIIGRLQIEQVNTGGVQTNITIPMLKSLYIVLPAKELQEEITSKLKLAFDKKFDSKRYLEMATDLLEKTIYSVDNE